MLPPFTRAVVCSALVLLTPGARTASAQDAIDPERMPIGRFVADARGLFTNFTDDPTLASVLGVRPDNLAERGLGFVVGAHLYPLRRGAVVFGFGGEVVVSRGSKTRQPLRTGDPEGPTVRAELSAISPQVSLNFGRRDGWSYVSGGMGWSRFATEPVGVRAIEEAPLATTINYGGGARWFMKRHLAFTFDLRFYRVAAQGGTASRLDFRFIEEDTIVRPSLAPMRLLMVSAGVAFK